MAKRMVPGQLSLTDEEFERAVLIAAHGAQRHGLAVLTAWGEDLVRPQVASINELRLGTAPDEIRRSEAGSIARRGQAADGSLCWQYTYIASADPIPNGDPDDWRTIHPSTWRDRVCDSDFKEPK